MKRVLVIFLVFVSVFFVLAMPATAAAEIKVYLDGRQLVFDVNPQIINGRTLVPMRKIFEELGAFVTWEETTKTITASKADIIITMQINHSVMQKTEIIFLWMLLRKLLTDAPSFRFGLLPKASM